MCPLDLTKLRQAKNQDDRTFPAAAILNLQNVKDVNILLIKEESHVRKKETPSTTKNVSFKDIGSKLVLLISSKFLSKKRVGPVL